jgi:hypothetical protein
VYSYEVVAPVPIVRFVQDGVHDCQAQDVPVPLCNAEGRIIPVPNAELALIAPPTTYIPYIDPVLLVVYPVMLSAVIEALVIVGELIVGLVSVLFVKVCVAVFWVTEDGKVGVPPIVYVPDKVSESVAPLIVGLVSVLLESVWLSVSPTGALASPSKVLRLIPCVAVAEAV